MPKLEQAQKRSLGVVATLDYRRGVMHARAQHKHH